MRNKMYSLIFQLSQIRNDDTKIGWNSLTFLDPIFLTSNKLSLVI